MKITRLKIKNLHGHINYNINFNDNITFLYGDNGCGKTTILNIMTNIITGKIYELFRYNFEEIVLCYISTKNNKREKITITYDENENINLVFLGETVSMEIQNYKFMNRNVDEIENVERFYFSEYPVLKEIRDTFNYIYLPLNRNGTIMADSYNMRYRKMTPSNYANSRNRFSNNIDSALLDVQALVSSAYSKENFTLKHISEEFSDEILKSFLDVENITSMGQIIKYVKSLDAKSIRTIQSDYVKVLKTINKWNNNTEMKINSFFDSLINDIDNSKNDSNGIAVELFFKLSELSKITNIIVKAEATESSKKKAQQPIENFINTVNGFISSNSNEKMIYIEDDGTLYLKTEYNKRINIQNMSSGEKQIVTFFAYLIFGLETTNQSIFIVDEPELSLHLNWQRKFIDAIMSINQNVQLIFATHAPEIIGRHRDKAIKLIPRV